VNAGESTTAKGIKGVRKEKRERWWWTEERAGQKREKETPEKES